MSDRAFQLRRSPDSDKLGGAYYSVSGALILANSDDGGQTVFEVDQTGAMWYAGWLYNSARISGGLTVESFNSKTTAPTAEDTGTATLIGGTAIVPLDRPFAATIDPRAVPGVPHTER